MTNVSLAMAWLQLLALLAAEVGLIAVGVALLRCWSPTAAWRRTVCQAGVTAVLVVTVCELSGSARVLGSWVASALHGQFMGHSRSGPMMAPESAAVLDQPNESRPAGPTSRFVADQAPAPRTSDRSAEAFPDKPMAVVGRVLTELPGPRAVPARSARKDAGLPG